MRVSDPAATLQTVVAAIPDNQLRSVLISVLLDGLSPGAGHGSPAPVTPKSTRGWPKGKPRKSAPGNGATAIDPKLEARRQRAYAQRRAKRAAARAAKAAAAKSGSAAPKPPRGRPRIKPAPAGATGNGAHPIGRDKSSAAAFWSHAELLSPTKAWHSVARELGVNLAVEQDAFRLGQIPPNINAAAAARSLELTPG